MTARPLRVGIGGLEEFRAVLDVDNAIGLDDETEGFVEAAGEAAPDTGRGAHPHFAVARGDDERAGRGETDGDDAAAHLGGARDIFDAVAGAGERGEEAAEQQEADGGDHGVAFPKSASSVNAPAASRVRAVAGWPATT